MVAMEINPDMNFMIIWTKLMTMPVVPLVVNQLEHNPTLIVKERNNLTFAKGQNRPVRFEHEVESTSTANEQF